MKKKYVWRTIILLVVCSVLLVTIMNKEKNTNGKGLFSWYIEQVSETDVFDFYKNQNITQVYQMFSSQTDNMDIADYLHRAKEANIDVYSLAGEAEWATNPHADEMKSQIDRIYKYNSLVPEEEYIKGIVFDIEPYSLSEWKAKKDDIMQTYLEALKEIREYTSNLEIYICIPFYYDRLGYVDFLETAIAKYVDGVMVMNYSVGHEIENIECEVNLCKIYGKKLINIYEFAVADNKSVTKANTYHDLGIAAADHNFSKLYKHFDYGGIIEAYHAYHSLREMD